MERKHWILILIVLSTFLLRLVLAFSLDNFTPDSYFHLRQVESIMETGFPAYQDTLSYGGRTYIFLPLYHYITAALAFVIPLEILAKILNSLCFSFLPVIVFFISKKINVMKNSPLFSAVVASLLPVTFQTNSFTPLPFALLFLFLTLYFFISSTKTKQQRSLAYYFVACLAALFLSSPLASMLIFGLLFYLLLSSIEETRIFKAELELVIFSTFFFLWVQLIFFKDVFLQEGVAFIWKNIPNQIYLEYFPKVSLTETILYIGVIPLLGGLFFIYNGMLEKKNKNVFLLISFAISSIVLTWLRLIEFKTSLVFLGLLLSIIFTSFYEEVIEFYEKTRISSIDKKIKKKLNAIPQVKRFTTITTTILLLILIPSLLIPSITFALQEERISDDLVFVFEHLKENTDNGALILTDIDEAHALSYFSERPNFMDANFRLIDDAEDRFEAFQTLYTGIFQTEAIKLLDAYDIEYIVVSSTLKEDLGIKKIEYISPECFSLIFSHNGNEVYKVKCGLEQS